MFCLACLLIIHSFSGWVGGWVGYLDVESRDDRVGLGVFVLCLPCLLIVPQGLDGEGDFVSCGWVGWVGGWVGRGEGGGVNELVWVACVCVCGGGGGGGGRGDQGGWNEVLDDGGKVGGWVGGWVGGRRT